jgi:hypothetical protein
VKRNCHTPEINRKRQQRDSAHDLGDPPRPVYPHKPHPDSPDEQPQQQKWRAARDRVGG